MEFSKPQEEISEGLKLQKYSHKIDFQKWLIEKIKTIDIKNDRATKGVPLLWK